MEKLFTIIDGPRLVACDFARKQIKESKKQKKIFVSMSSESKISFVNGKDQAVIRWSIQSNNPGVPFRFNIEVEGLFKILKPADKDELVQAVARDAGPILFVCLRGMIGELSTRADLPPFYPDYPDFNKLAGKEKKNRSGLMKKNKSKK